MYILQIVCTNFVYEFLGSALSPPETAAVTNAVLFLESLNAVLIDNNNNSNSTTTVVSISSKLSATVSSSSSGKERRIQCQITPLGFHLAALPISPRIGKLMLYGVLLGCIDPVLTIAAVMSAKSPFVMPFNERDAADAAKMSFMGGNSDLITVLNAYDSWRSIVDKGREGAGTGTGSGSSGSVSGGGGGSSGGEGKGKPLGDKGDNNKDNNINKTSTTPTATSTRREEEQYCRSHFLSITSLRLVEQMRGQFLNLLKGIGFMPNTVTTRNIQTCNENINGDVKGGNISMVKNAICAGLSPHILMTPPSNTSNSSNNSKSSQNQSQNQAGITSFGTQILQKNLGELSLKQKRKGNMSVHPSSVMYTIKKLDSKFLLYLDSLKTSKMYARDVTTVSPIALALFSGRLKCNEVNGYVLVDGWIKIICTPKVVKCLTMVIITLTLIVIVTISITICIYIYITISIYYCVSVRCFVPIFGLSVCTL